MRRLAEAVASGGHRRWIKATPFNSFLADLDNDGDPDIVVQMLDRIFGTGRDPASGRMVVALNDGKGHFAAVDPFSLASNEHRGGMLRPVDYYGDGDLDLIEIHPAAAVQIGGEFFSGGFPAGSLHQPDPCPEIAQGEISLRHEVGSGSVAQHTL